MQRGFRLARALPVHTQRSARFRVAQQTRTFAEQSNATAGAKETVQNAKNKAASAFDKFPKHPDYEGVEAIFRYYMPHNYQVSSSIYPPFVSLLCWYCKYWKECVYNAVYMGYVAVKRFPIPSLFLFPLKSP